MQDGFLYLHDQAPATDKCGEFESIQDFRGLTTDLRATFPYTNIIAISWTKKITALVKLQWRNEFNSIQFNSLFPTHLLQQCDI